MFLCCAVLLAPPLRGPLVSKFTLPPPSAVAEPLMPLETLPAPLGEWTPKPLVPSAAPPARLVAAAFRADPSLVRCAESCSVSGPAELTVFLFSRRLPQRGSIAGGASDSPRIFLFSAAPEGAPLPPPLLSSACTSRGPPEASSFASREVMSCGYFFRTGRGSRNGRNQRQEKCYFTTRAG